jgi:hypothetical protein
MKRSTARWTTAMAAAALIGLPRRGLRPDDRATDAAVPDVTGADHSNTEPESGS